MFFFFLREDMFLFDALGSKIELVTGTYDFVYDNKPLINWSVSVLVLIEIKVVITLPLSLSTRFHFICKMCGKVCT